MDFSNNGHAHGTSRINEERRKDARKTPRCRKYAHRKVNRKTHSAQGVNGRSGDSYERNVDM